MALKILEVEVSPRVEEKINSAHGVTIDDVEAALSAVLNSQWDEDPERGRRLYVWGRAGRRVVFVCLMPVNERHGIWRLATAYPDLYP